MSDALGDGEAHAGGASDDEHALEVREAIDDGLDLLGGGEAHDGTEDAMCVLEVGEGVLPVVSHAMMTKKGSASWGVLEEDGEDVWKL